MDKDRGSHCKRCVVPFRPDDQSSVKKRHTVMGSSKLYDAVLDKDKSKFYEILQQQDVNLRSTYNNGNTLLHLIVLHFDEKDVNEIVQIFLTKDINLYLKNECEETILHIAVARRMKKTIDFLLKNGFEIEMIYEPSNPLPHFFIEKEYENYLNLLKLERDDPPNCHRESEEKVIANFLEWLISKGFDFDRHEPGEQSALLTAMERNLQHILPTLLKHSIDINFFSKNFEWTLLHSFIRINNASKDGTLNCRRQIWSVDFGQRYTVEIVKALLDKGVCVDAVDIFGDTALHMLMREKIQMEISEMLLDRFTNVQHKNNSGRTVLHEVTTSASRASTVSEAEYYLKIMRHLVAKGADVNAKCKNGSTPVCDVVKAKNLSAIRLMKENNADFSVTFLGCTMLHYLAMKKCNDTSTDESQEAIFELLIGGGCNVNALDAEGQSPLHLAIRDRHTVIIKKLIAHGSNVNCREKREKKTPLILVVERVFKEMSWYDEQKDNITIQMLLERGAHVNARDKSKQSALARAIKFRNDTAVAKLLRYGADINDPSVIQDILALEKIHWVSYTRLGIILSKHWIKLKAANFYCSEMYADKIKVADYESTYKNCLQETDRLKNISIDNRTSLYRWLHMDPNQKCIHINNEKLKKLVDSLKLEEQFSEYGGLIFTSYHETVARKPLLEAAKEAWIELTGIRLPDICMERIFCYLSNADLLDMLEESEY